MANFSLKSPFVCFSNFFGLKVCELKQRYLKNKVVVVVMDFVVEAKRLFQILSSGAGNGPVEAREEAYYQYCLKNGYTPKWFFDQKVYALGLKELKKDEN